MRLVSFRSLLPAYSKCDKGSVQTPALVACCNILFDYIILPSRRNGKAIPKTQENPLAQAGKPLQDRGDGRRWGRQVSSVHPIRAWPVQRSVGPDN